MHASISNSFGVPVFSAPFQVADTYSYHFSLIRAQILQALRCLSLQIADDVAV